MFRHTKAFSGFSVDNLEKAKQFYGELLGLEIADVMGLLELRIEGGTHILIYPKPDHTPATFTILNFPVSDIEQAVDELIRIGIVFEHYDTKQLKTDPKGIFRGGGPRIAWFKDPAGNILSVIEQESDAEQPDA